MVIVTSEFSMAIFAGGTLNQKSETSNSKYRNNTCVKIHCVCESIEKLRYGGNVLFF